MKYRKTALTDAIQWTGDNTDEVFAFTQPALVMEGSTDEGTAFLSIPHPEGPGGSLVRTYAHVGDWVLKDSAGNFYCCTADVFAATYEPAEG